MPLASFPDAELDQVLRAAQPLSASCRSEFLAAVAKALEGHEPGPGNVHRAIIRLQREFLTGRRGEPYRRRG